MKEDQLLSRLEMMENQLRLYTQVLVIRMIHTSVKRVKALFEILVSDEDLYQYRDSLPCFIHDSYVSCMICYIGITPSKSHVESGGFHTLFKK